MQIRPTAFTIGLIIHSFITLFFVYTEFGIGSIIFVIINVIVNLEVNITLGINYIIQEYIFQMNNVSNAELILPNVMPMEKSNVILNLKLLLTHC